MTTELDIETEANDPVSLMAAFDAMGDGEQPQSGSEQKQTPDAGEAAAGEKQAGSQATEPEQKAEPEADPATEAEQAEGVATKDGKHVIPYSVLKGERERAARAEALVREAQERVQALEQQLQQKASQGANDGEGARTDGTQEATDDLSDDDLEVLREDFPTVYKVLMATQAKAKALEAKLEPVAESVREANERSQRTATEQVQDAIDAVPKMAHIQANDPKAFALAQQFDAVLRDQPAWAGKPLQERFAKVAQMVEDANGAIELPAAAKQATGSQGKAGLAEQAKAKAAQAAKAAVGAGVPTSLSEFSAGEAPAVDEMEALEAMSNTQLAAKFSRMSPDQLDAYLSNI